MLHCNTIKKYCTRVAKQPTIYNHNIEISTNLQSVTTCFVSVERNTSQI